MSTYNAAILEAAAAYIGTTEWPGAKHNPVIRGFAEAIGSDWVNDDETPWCASFVGAILGQLGLPHTGKMNARSYVDYGSKVSFAEFRPGDIVVFRRGKSPTAGHVAFGLGIHGDRIEVRGGNQSNKVSDALYPLADVIAIRRAVKVNVGENYPTLRLGQKGLMVGDLQVKLNKLGYNLGKVDGVFGKLTRDAVLVFQADNSLELDGVVGPQTWDALEAAAPKEATREDLTVKDLRDRKSTTVANADKVDVTADAMVVLGLGKEVAMAAQEASGILPTITKLLQEHWLTLVVIIGGYAAFKVFSYSIRQARLDDARTGRNIGR